MRFEIPSAGNYRHSLKKLRSHVFLFISGILFISQGALASGNSQAVEMKIDSTCQADRPLAGNQRVAFIRMAGSLSKRSEYRKYVGTPEQNIYEAKYREVLEFNEWLYKDMRGKEYYLQLINQEELLTLGTQILGERDPILRKMDDVINRWDNPPSMALLATTFVAFKVAVLKRLDDIKDGQYKHPNAHLATKKFPLKLTAVDYIKVEDVDVLKRRILASLETVYGFWVTYVPRRQAEFQESLTTKTLYIKGLIGTSGLVGSTLLARAALKATVAGGLKLTSSISAEAATKFVSSTAFSCINGAVGAMSYTATFDALKVHLRAWDASKRNQTSMACEIARIQERESTADQIKNFMYAAGTGTILGCVAGAAANLAPKVAPRIMIGALGVSGLYDVGATGYAIYNSYQAQKLYESLIKFNGAEKALSEGDQLLATKYLLEAESYAREAKLHFAEAFYKVFVTYAVLKELHELKHAFEHGRRVLIGLHERTEQMLADKTLRKQHFDAFARGHGKEDRVGVVAAASDIVPIAVISILRFYRSTTDYLGLQNIPRPPESVMHMTPEHLLKEVIVAMTGEKEVKAEIQKAIAATEVQNH